MPVSESRPPRIKQAPAECRAVDLPGVEWLTVLVRCQMLKQALFVQLPGNLQI